MLDILIVDDSRVNRILLMDLLKDYKDIKIYTADNGETGIKMAKDLKPSLITLDIMMPKMNGWQVLETIKNDIDLKDTEIVIVSNVSNKNKAKAFGAIDCLNKPISKNDLIGVFKKYFKHNCQSVMIVDDEPDIIDMMIELIQDDVQDIKTANNGQKAFDLLEAGYKPDLIFLDLMMPDIDGFKFMEMISKKEEYADLNIIVVSAKDFTKEDLNILNRQNINIIHKGGDLEKAVKTALTLKD